MLQLLWSDFESIVSSTQEQFLSCSSPCSVKAVRAELIPLARSGQFLNEREQVQRTREPVSKMCGGVWEGRSNPLCPGGWDRNHLWSNWDSIQSFLIFWCSSDSSRHTATWLEHWCSCVLGSVPVSEMLDEPRNLTWMGWQLFGFPTQDLPYRCVIAMRSPGQDCLSLYVYAVPATGTPMSLRACTVAQKNKHSGMSTYDFRFLSFNSSCYQAQLYLSGLPSSPDNSTQHEIVVCRLLLMPSVSSTRVWQTLHYRQEYWLVHRPEKSFTTC